MHLVQIYNQDTDSLQWCWMLCAMGTLSNGYNTLKSNEISQIPSDKADSVVVYRSTQKVQAAP